MENQELSEAAQAQPCTCSAFANNTSCPVHSGVARQRTGTDLGGVGRNGWAEAQQYAQGQRAAENNMQFPYSKDYHTGAQLRVIPPDYQKMLDAKDHIISDLRKTLDYYSAKERLENAISVIKGRARTEDEDTAQLLHSAEAFMRARRNRGM